MKKLRNISIILLIISAIVMINATWAWFDDFLHPNNWLHGLGMLVGGVLFALFLPATIAGVCGIRYYTAKGKRKLTACWVWGCIAAVVYCTAIFLYVFVIGVHSDPRETLLLAVVFMVIPIALFLLACQQEQSAKRQKTLDNN